MDDHRLDINDLRVLGTRLGGTKAEKKTEDKMTTLTDTEVKETNGRVQEGNGTKTSDQQKKTEDDHRRDINDSRVLGTRLGGTKTEDHRARMTVMVTMMTDTKGRR